MSLHKLTAGSGYDYLTRQVAVQDTTEKGYVGLASYYTERGETPGVWVGAGCLGLTLFKKRKALFDKVMGRKAAPSEV